jgi:drug/metabolite transporter (DMT)-like permease
MGVMFGLIAALCWGVADFCTTQVTRRIGVTRTILFFESVALLATVILLLAWPGAPTASVGIWLRMGAIGLLNLVGTAVLYRAFMIGTLALVAPIAAGYAVVTALLALLTGERPALLPLGGALLLVTGVIVIASAQPVTSKVTLAGVPEALASILIFGVFFWSLQFVTSELGVLWPVLVLRLMKTSGALLVLGRRRTAPGRLTPGTAALVLTAALAGTAAFAAYNLGISTAYTSIVTAVASLSTVVTVLLARSILHERLSRGQWFGAGVILAGVLLVSI